MNRIKQTETNFSVYFAEFIGKAVTFLEIGVFKGRTSRWLFENILTHPDSKLVGIDPWKKEYFSRHDVRDDSAWREVMNSIEKIKQDYVGRVEMIKGLSSEVLKRDGLQKIKFDGIYIDGDHTYDSVISDFNLSWPLLKNGGVLIFDDYIIYDKKTNKIDMQMQFGIDKILFDFKGEYEFLFKSRQVGIRKAVS